MDCLFWYLSTALLIFDSTQSFSWWVVAFQWVHRIATFEMFCSNFSLPCNWQPVFFFRKMKFFMVKRSQVNKRQIKFSLMTKCLTLSWRRTSISYRNQSVDLFVYDRELCHEIAKALEDCARVSWCNTTIKPR